MSIAKILKLTAIAATLSAAVVSYAQDIKLGFNGDLSASPSAQSGKAGVIGIEAAIADINAAGGVLGRKLTEKNCVYGHDWFGHGHNQADEPGG
jgi:branched-chain amino acid transport system substrate-binding protein